MHPRTALGPADFTRPPDHTGDGLAGTLAPSVAKGSPVRTDGLRGCAQLAKRGYAHAPEKIGKDASRAAELLPRVHRVASLLKRWLLGTHQGAVSGKHLASHLAEFEFRFNRRNAKPRTSLFEALVGIAVRRQGEPLRQIVESPAQPLYVLGT